MKVTSRDTLNSMWRAYLSDPISDGEFAQYGGKHTADQIAVILDSSPRRVNGGQVGHVVGHNPNADYQVLKDALKKAVI